VGIPAQRDSVLHPTEDASPLWSSIRRPSRRRHRHHGGFHVRQPLSVAARFLGLSGRTLEKHRTFGTGPIYRKLGGRIVYALDDLQAWADRGLRQSTSDPGHGIVHPAKPQTPRDDDGAPYAR